MGDQCCMALHSMPVSVLSLAVRPVPVGLARRLCPVAVPVPAAVSFVLDTGTRRKLKGLCFPPAGHTDGNGDRSGHTRGAALFLCSSAPLCSDRSLACPVARDGLWVRPSVPSGPAQLQLLPVPVVQQQQPEARDKAETPQAQALRNAVQSGDAVPSGADPPGSGGGAGSSGSSPVVLRSAFLLLLALQHTSVPPPPPSCTAAS
jgi:hypothetical protein